MRSGILTYAGEMERLRQVNVHRERVPVTMDWLIAEPIVSSKAWSMPCEVGRRRRSCLKKRLTWGISARSSWSATSCAEEVIVRPFVINRPVVARPHTGGSFTIDT